MNCTAGQQFDAVCALEVAEHVSQPEAFAATLASLVKPGGALLVSTMNRTPRAYAMAVVGAERIMQLLPVGTHDWTRFITPGRAALAASGGHGMALLAASRPHCATRVSLSQLRACDEDSCKGLLPRGAAWYLKTSCAVWAWLPTVLHAEP